MVAMKRGSAALLSLTLAAGCATAQWSYEKPNVSPAKQDRDMAACRKDSPSHSPFAIFQTRAVDRTAFNRCMEQRGYKVTSG